MAWDAELADKRASEFQEELQVYIKQLREPIHETYHIIHGLEALQELQALWKKYYGTTGHKRLARVFLKESFD